MEMPDCAGGTACCGPEAIQIDDNFGSTLYAEDERDTLPAEALAASLGCGNPTAVADLKKANASWTSAPAAASTYVSGDDRRPRRVSQHDTALAEETRPGLSTCAWS